MSWVTCDCGQRVSTDIDPEAIQGDDGGDFVRCEKCREYEDEMNQPSNWKRGEA